MGLPARTKRNRELAVIHIRAGELALDDAAYREMLQEVAGVRSAADLDESGRLRVLEHLKGLSEQKELQNPRPEKPVRPPYPGRPANMDDEDRGRLLHKIEALLTDAGRPWAYADGLARHMFRIDRTAWCYPDQLHKIVAALMIDQRRRRGGTKAT